MIYKKQDIISIHAPPRGATIVFTRCRTLSEYFNSRPSARGDAAGGSGSHSGRQFQFTPLREGRQETRKLDVESQYISIHAPPRGATTAIPGFAAEIGFQFTPLREGRPVLSPLVTALITFQFTPLREGRPLQHSQHATLKIFQFTPLREGRQNGNKVSKCIILFQFTPLREGRRNPLAPANVSSGISIHAPPRGATCRFACCFLAFCISIHAPPRGATSATGEEGMAMSIFQFTPLREGRPDAESYII